VLYTVKLKGSFIFNIKPARVAWFMQTLPTDKPNKYPSAQPIPPPAGEASPGRALSA